MYEVPCYRVEVKRNGKVVKTTFAHSQLDDIIKGLNELNGLGSTVNVYHRYGKKVVFEYRG